MGDRLKLLGGLFGIPAGIVIRRLDIKLNKEDRLSNADFNNWFYQRIIDNTPTAVVRFGGTEMKSFRKYEINRAFNINLDMQSEVTKLSNLSGYFPNSTERINEFCKLNISLMPDIDAIGCWDLAYEKYFIEKYCRKDIVKTDLENLEPYYSETPWSKALKGKKVLLIHPFADSIRHQYENNREKLFKNSDILPEFELKTLKAVQSLGGIPDGDFKDWFEAYDYMLNEALKADFDVAIIGCGAYGMPLALRLKQEGKIAIHLGGATQMLFGVYGQRWEDNKEGLINGYWVRPMETERSMNFNKVEGGCYW